MKKIYLILLLSIFCEWVEAQIAGLDSNSVAILLPIGLQPNRLTFYQEARDYFGIVVTDSLPRLRMQRWAFARRTARDSFMARSGQYSAYLERDTLTLSEPSKPRPRVSDDDNPITGVIYHWNNRFLRTCANPISVGRTPVRVAIIDCGIQLNSNSVPQDAGLSRFYDRAGSRNFTQSGNNLAVQDAHPRLHGTRVASVIAAIYDSARMDNTLQKLTIFKVFNERGEAELWDLLRAIDACIAQRIHIVNLSFNYKAPLLPNTGIVRAKLLLEEAINVAKNYNILFITAAGNDGNNVDASRNMGFFPTHFQCENLIKVAADSVGQPAFFSNYGATNVDIAAPGIMSTSIILRNEQGDTLSVSRGTSFAAPVVTAVAAIEASKLNRIEWWRIKAALQSRLFRANALPTNWQGKTIGLLKPLCE
jgi:subtilisin family serine protease